MLIMCENEVVLVCDASPPYKLIYFSNIAYSVMTGSDGFMAYYIDAIKTFLHFCCDEAFVFPS
jgi:hypothetical protein